MLKPIDQLLNRLTMYRLLLYYLIALLVIALWFSHIGHFHFGSLNLIASSGIAVASCWSFNKFFAGLFNAPVNNESSILTGLILALIITPSTTLAGITFLLAACVIAMASKYLLVIRKVHLFNPAAAGVFIAALFSSLSASWWIANQTMLPFVIIGGLLLARKIQRLEMITWFVAIALLTTVFLAHVQGNSASDYFGNTLTSSAIFFMGFVMLTEPMTSPTNSRNRRIYAAVAGLLFAPQMHLGNFYTTPQLDLLIVNVLAYLMSAKIKVLPTLIDKQTLGPNIEEFVFKPDRKFNFKPGQYMEWTLPHDKADSRGDRRYFTIASSPTEDELRLGIKFYPDGSSYKRKLLSLKPAQKIFLSASQLGGDFTLPNDPNQKIVFIAGGIGVTPYRSMIQYLIDSNQKRNVTLIYAVNKSSDIVYKSVFESARAKLNIDTKYIVSQPEAPLGNGDYLSGVVTPELITKQVPDFKQRLFYISGPRPMVEAIRQSLRQTGVSSSKVKVDFFPGY